MRETPFIFKRPGVVYEGSYRLRARSEQAGFAYLDKRDILIYTAGAMKRANNNNSVNPS